MSALTVCRAGGLLVVTGIGAAYGRTPWAVALIGAGTALLALGGWMISKRGRR